MTREVEKCLSNDNKYQSITLLFRVWRSEAFIPKLQNNNIITVCEGKAYIFETNGKKVTLS